MFKLTGITFLTFLSLIATAQIVVPDTVQDQIITDVMTQSGYYDAAEIEARIRAWRLEQPQPRSSGELTDSGACSPTCIKTGGDVNLPKPRNVKYKGKEVEGKFTQNLIIKWKRPQALPENSSYKLKNYKIILSKGGVTYEKYKVKAKFKNNGKPKKHQKLKLRGLEEADYQVQVRATYKTINNTSSANKSNASNKSAGLTSLWTGSEGGSSKPADPAIVGVLDHNSVLYQCLIAGGLAIENNNKVPVTDSTELNDVFFLDCSSSGMTNADVQSLDVLISLVILDISDNSLVTDVSSLGQLVLLEQLNISQNQNPQFDFTALEDKKITLKALKP